ncbi:MAG: M20/M25/M40 family metallo-hydrolase, partial [Bacteroidales bacterium]
MIQLQIKELAARYFNETVSVRRHLHQHPELSFQEKDTAAFISARLTSYGIKHSTDVGGHGIIAIIEGRNPEEKCLALRAELDALPIQESSSQSYCSVNEGIMHACGHDAHAAMLLTAGQILHKMKMHFDGSIKLI